MPPKEGSNSNENGHKTINIKHSVATGANELKISSLIISHVLQSLYLCLEKKIFAVTNTFKDG